MYPRSIPLGIALCLLLGPALRGQTTTVSVRKGAVRAQTTSGQATVNAGQKTVLQEGRTPIVAVNDPFVQDALEIYQWVQEEKKVSSERIENTVVQVTQLQSQDLMLVAVVFEKPTDRSEPNSVCTIGLTSILDDPAFYDLDGHLLAFELEPKNENQGYYRVHYPAPVAPGELFKGIMACRYRTEPGTLVKDGPIWHLRLGNCTRNSLNYFRIILPDSGIFVRADRPLTCVATRNGRMVLTLRNYTGDRADGMYTISFLWPAKDGTSLADLPILQRGVLSRTDQGLRDAYRQQMQKILGGERFRDLSTPLNALLTHNCAVLNRDKDLYLAMTYLGKTQPDKVASMIGAAFWEGARLQFIDGCEFLGTVAWPDKPARHTIISIYLSAKGSTDRVDTLAFVWDGDGWYWLGNMGNPLNTDVGLFRRYLIEP